MNDATPTPLILDTTVLHDLARGDIDTINLVQGYDADGQPMVVPALAITATLLATHTDDAIDAMHGIALFEHVTVAPLRDTEQATSLAEMIAATGLDVSDAHVAAVADASICPILTSDATRWEHARASLEDPLHIIEIADPES